MTTALVVRIAEAWALAATVQLVLWLVQQRTNNAGIVDVGWALSFAPIVALFAWRSTACACGWGVIAAIVVVWSLRLGGYLIARGAARAPEEGRYKELRAKWGPNASRNFFVFFQAQAALTGVLSSAFAVPFIAEPTAVWPRALGGAIAILGILGESIADAQLARFKRANPGMVCDIGLWSWSRHHNYFFEWCLWIGYASTGWGPAGWRAAEDELRLHHEGGTVVAPIERDHDGAWLSGPRDPAFDQPPIAVRFTQEVGDVTLTITRNYGHWIDVSPRPTERLNERLAALRAERWESST